MKTWANGEQPGFAWGNFFTYGELVEILFDFNEKKLKFFSLTGGELSADEFSQKYFAPVHQKTPVRFIKTVQSDWSLHIQAYIEIDSTHEISTAEWEFDNNESWPDTIKGSKKLIKRIGGEVGGIYKK